MASTQAGTRKERAALNDHADNSRNAGTPSETAAGSGVAAALSYVARHFGLPVGVAELVEGLPTRSEDDVALDYFTEAARRAGLNSRLERRPLSAIPRVSLPAVLFLQSGDAVVMTDLHRRTAKIVQPSIGETAQSVRLRTLQSDYSGVCAFLSPARRAEETLDDAEPDQAKGNWFWSAALRFWPSYLQVIVAALLVNLLALASPIFVMNVYDRVIPNLAIPTLWALTVGVAIAILLDMILRLLRSAVVDETGRRVDMAVSGRIFDHLVGARLATRSGSTGLTASQVKEFDSVRDVLTSSSVIAATDAAFIGVFLYVLYLIVGPLVIAPAVAVPLVILSTLICQAPLSRAMRQGQMEASHRHAVLIETVGSLETVKSVGAAGVLRGRWDRAVAATSRSTARARFWSNLAMTIMTTTQQSVSIVIVVYGVYLIIDGSITVGALIAANILSGRVLAPLANIAQTMSRIAQARAAFSSLSQFMRSERETASNSRDASRAPRSGSIAFTDVTFRYPDAQADALAGVDFAARSGERIGVLGRIGSGKSTLGRVMSGLYAPTGGGVLLDEADLRQFDPATARRTIGYLSQDAELFTGSLRDNINIGAPHASDEDVRWACETSGVDAFASRHPFGLNMPIVERGRNLSGGQRQSVALARLLIRKPKVLFLDEPTAAMDSATEKALIDRLRRIAESGVTLFIATHRDAPLVLVDRLLVFDQGKLAMDGPKDEVVAALQRTAAERQAGSRARQ